jgi:hypothetical protein
LRRFVATFKTVIAAGEARLAAFDEKMDQNNSATGNVIKEEK